MKRFLSRVLLLLPLLAGLIVTNWFVDPDHIRNPDAYERGIARLLLEGKAVTNIDQADESAVMWHYFSGLERAPQVLILGSSRAKLIRSEVFPGRTFFNASLSGGSLTDYLALTHLMQSRGLLPRRMVIELSTWFVDGDFVSVWPRFAAQDQALADSLLNGQPFPEDPQERQSLEAYSRLVAPDYFQLSFFTLLDTYLGDGQGSGYHVFREGDEPTGLTYLADGSEIFPLKRRKNLGTPSVDALAIAAGQSPLGIPTRIDARRQALLEAYLVSLDTQGVEIILYLAPYHPKTYEIMLASPDTRIVAEIQAYYEEMARHFGWQIIGSYNPADLNITGAVYYDATHITSETLARIFADIK